MSLKRKYLAQLSGFDERFRTHSEDVEFAFKLKRAGLQFVYNPDLSVNHLRVDNMQSLKKMLYNHIYWSCVVHNLYDKPYFLRYFAASFKILIKQCITALVKSKYKILPIAGCLFVVRLTAINNSRFLNKKAF